MAEKPNPRIKNLSTRYLRFYKFGVAFGILAMVVALVIHEIRRQYKGGHTMIFLPLSYGYFIYLWWQANKRVYHTEFDEEYVYVQQQGHDVLIPLENIKDVNLISVGGVYKVDLYSPETFGDKFYFKPSLLYPFNHKKKEAIVDVLWANIEKAKKRKQVLQRNALMS
ncbi:MAG: hypothetical protein JSU09_00555 [Bacteroidetes bacterium]|nr:hypothetical protein [Bacteroidota bacterium]